MASCAVLAVSDPNILYLLTRYVEESGLQAVLAGGYADVAETAARREAALVIVETGTAAGEAAVRELRARPATLRTPVLLYAPGGRCAGEDHGGEDGGATACLQEYLMYDQFVAELRRVGVRLPAASRPRAPGPLEARV